MERSSLSDIRPLVSVIMPTYNSSKYVSEAVESVIAQTYGFENIEICIVDDKSTDNTPDILLEYSQRYKNIYYVQLEKNSGTAVARNTALRIATGRFFAFLDSDDVWYANKLEIQIGYMLANNIEFSATGYEQIDESGESLHTALIPPCKTNYKQLLQKACPIGNLTCVYDADKIGKIEVPLIKKRNDFALWLAVLKRINCCIGLPEVLAKYRVRSGSISHNKLSLIKYHWHLYHDIEKIGCVKSAWLILCWMFIKVTGLSVKRKRI